MIENHNIVNLEKESFENAVEKDFGLSVVNTEKIIKGYSNQVYKGYLSDNPVFIRMNKDPNLFEVELVGYKIFEEKGIPVPEIIAYKEKPELLGYPTMIMSSAKGTALVEADLPQDKEKLIFEKIGELARKINETKVDGFGPFVVKDGNLVGKFQTWKEYFESLENHKEKNLNFLIENNFITTEESQKIREISNEIYSLDFGRAFLLHRDLHKYHIFTDGDNITGVIDLGGLTASDPRYEIANSLVFQDPEEQESFKRGYGDLAYDPVVDKYLMSIAAKKIYFRSKKEIKGDIDRPLFILKNLLKRHE